MTILLLLIPISLFLGGLGLLAFWLALRGGQFDDPEGNAARILEDRDPD
ncbi:cbb3-type cytochrome oxidase assembly protein CcoS [Halovulum dunhuangense]|uniref:Cbb3-type cytochrome oxidase assembly protein CcoS n=1 Tax=Halovulum dunhuangense TaxID=1505036 RepID=A0A849KV90_9RHOB|nr:cbb3-type cytochrome oxidase assembly protein CcoS [Halovulum dunhuangense]NNU78965.1 cbb3-type cytochrome oxidase assembly protein CcoS [Halovulum dunhuangense]